MRAWLFDQALPLWAEAGVGRDGGFHEALDFDGHPISGLPRRTRVQARQVYVFAQGAALGWAPGRAVAQAGLERMIATCRRDDGLWRLTTDADGAPADETADLYDQAFVLFALAAAHRVLGDARALPLARQTLETIRERMTSPHGGWDEAIPPILPRRQNPHMHLLEAMLAWREAAPDPLWDQTAKVSLDLFRGRFLSGGTVREYFTETWRPAPEIGHITEPGHLEEWAWLVRQSEAAGLAPDEGIPALLHRRVLSEGTWGAFLVREVGEQGESIDLGRRLWAQTESIRTCIALGHVDEAVELIQAVFETHLATAVPGLWMDSYDAKGRPCDARVPASTLYHLMTAFTAVLEPDA